MTLKIEVNKTYVDGRGFKVRVICTDMKTSFSVIGLTDGSGASERIERYSKNGQYYQGDDSIFDLIKEYKPPIIHQRKLIWYKSTCGKYMNCVITENLKLKIAYPYKSVKEEIISYEEKE